MKNDDKKKVKFILCIVIMIIAIFIIINICYNIPKWQAPYKEDIAKVDINKIYQNYMGNQIGSTVRNLLSTFENFNELNVNYPGIIVTYQIRQMETTIKINKIDIIKEKIKSNLRYEVSFNYSNDGIINEIIIEEIDK